MENLIFIFVVVLTVGYVLYKFRFLFNDNLKISNSQEELFKLAEDMYKSLNGKHFVLSAGELNYMAYNSFSKYIEKLVEKDGATFTIYCGPAISIDDKFKDYINEEGHLKDQYKNSWANVHPILKLKKEYDSKIILKLKPLKTNHFFYSEEDKVAWKEEIHEPFEESVSYFRKNIDKKVINNLKEIEKDFDNSIEITLDNASDKLKLYTVDMFKKVA